MDQATKGEPQLGSGVFWAQLARDPPAERSIAREWNFPDSVVQALAEQGGMRKGAVMSPLGRLLMLTDYLGKVRMLAEQGLVEDGDAGLWRACREMRASVTAACELSIPARHPRAGGDPSSLGACGMTALRA
jgi:hypothetical protein